MNDLFSVYVATNVSNGHRYVGYTSYSLSHRRSAHHGKAFRGERGCPKFHNALRRYGRDAFVWEVVSVFPTAGEALAEEMRLISDLRPEYNLTQGGEGTSGLPAVNRKAVTCLTDGRMFVSAAAAGKFYGLGHTAVSEICNGKYRSAGNSLHFIYGDVVYAPSERARLIREIEAAHAQRRKRVVKNAAHIGADTGRDRLNRRATGPQKLSREVVCVDDGSVHASASAAARTYNVARSAVIELCLGKNGRQTVGGLRFKYVEVP